MDPSVLGSLAATLKRAAEISPGRGVRFIRADGADEVRTYPELVAEAAKILTGLRRAGLQPGQKVILQLDRNEDFVPVFWACVLGGFVPVPISIPPGYDEPHSILAKLENAWNLLSRPLVLAGGTLADGLERFAARQGLQGFRAVAVGTLRDAVESRGWHPNQPDDIALMLLTSGSTGMPKGVQLSHRNILARSAATAQFDRFSSEDVSLNWMPLDHVGGLVMYHIRDVFLACDQIQAPAEIVLQRPLAWLDWISRYRVSITWAPNFAFGLINDQAPAIEKGRWDLSSMRFILNGGEAIVSKTARRFLELLGPHALPPDAMRPAWGMSETSSGVTSSHRFNLGSTADDDPFVEVGGPLPGTQLRIVFPDGTLVPEGKIGSLQVKGLSVTEGYFKNPELNAEAFTPDGWFKTGDLGVLREGRLTITGREKDVIIVNGVNYYSHEIEAVVEDVEGVEVSFTAAFAVRLPQENTDRIAVLFNHGGLDATEIPPLLRKIRSAIVAQEGVNPDYILPVAKEAIPKTAIGKIQRSQLKQQFERGDFASLVRKYGSAGGGAATLDWFYRPTWRAVPAGSSQLQPGASFLILADADGLAAALAEKLRALGHRCVLVEIGTGYAQLDPATYRLEPGNLAHYQLLLRALDGPPSHIVHAFTFGGGGGEPKSVGALEEAQKAGAHSLLGLVKALAACGWSENALRLLVVSSCSRPVDESDRIEYAKAPVLGLARTVGQEIAWLDCHHVDLEAKSPSGDSDRVLAELQGWDRVTESAWRGDIRKVPLLEKAEALPESRAIPFKEGGLYLLTGGTGGVGLIFARYLLQHFKAHLVIVGRSSLSALSDPNSGRVSPGSGAERLQACQALAALDGSFTYVAADVCDSDQLERVIAEAENKWQRPLDGILHMAGLYRESLLESETIEGLAAVMRPKVSGTWVLHQLAQRRPDCLFVNFSSLISYFGSLSTGAYAAANNFLDAFSHHQRHACGLRSYNLLWSSWTGIGMSRGYVADEALRSRGYFSIDAHQGVESLLYALRNDHPQLVVGIDGSNKSIQGHLSTEGTAATVSAPARLEEFVAPRSEIERAIATIWQQILRVPRVGLKDNFFELGGRSLLAAKMFAQLNKTLGKNLPIPALFKAPTIAQLSVLYFEHPKSASVAITAFQIGGVRPPLFIVPEVGSDGRSCEVLARQLDPDQPCVALQARALIGGSSQTVDVAGTARLFANEILAITPRGLCAVAGLGFGSILAWETARLLAPDGCAVSRLVLVNPPPKAFFQREGSGPTALYRLVRPAGEGGGLLGRFFRSTSDDGATKEMRQSRARLGEARLGPAPSAVAVFTAAPAELGPLWQELSPAGIASYQSEETGARLGEILRP